MDNITLTSLLLILGISLGTYTLRVSGLLLSNRFIENENVKVFLEYLPSTLLLALVVPSILKEGLAGLIAISLIVLCMYKTKSILLSMIIGVGVVALSRNFI